MGVVVFILMIFIFAGYIVYVIVDCFVFFFGLIGGWIVNNGFFYGVDVGIGFIGVIIVGFLVGYFVKWIIFINYYKFI